MPLSFASRRAAQRFLQGDTGARFPQIIQASESPHQAELCRQIRLLATQISKLEKKVDNQNKLLNDQSTKISSIYEFSGIAAYAIVCDQEQNYESIGQSLLSVEFGNNGRRVTIEKSAGDSISRADEEEWVKVPQRQRTSLHHAFVTGLDVNAQPKQILNLFQNSARFESISAICGKLTFNSKAALETAMGLNGTKSNLFFRGKVGIKAWNPKPNNQRQNNTQPKAAKAADTEPVMPKLAQHPAPKPVQQAAPKPANKMVPNSAQPRAPVLGQQAPIAPRGAQASASKEPEKHAPPVGGAAAASPVPNVWEQRAAVAASSSAMQAIPAIPPASGNGCDEDESGSQVQSQNGQALLDQFDSTRPLLEDQTPVELPVQAALIASEPTERGPGGAGGADTPARASAIPPRAAPPSPETVHRIRDTYDRRQNGSWVLGGKIVDRLAAAENLMTQSVPGDGMCQPRAIVRDLHSMGNNNYRDYRALKAGAAAFLKSLSPSDRKSLEIKIEVDLAEGNPDRGFIFSLSDSWMEDASKHFEGVAWGDEITLRVYAAMLKVNFQLWDAEDGHKHPLIKGMISASSRATRRNTQAIINLWYRRDKSAPIYNHKFEKIGVSDGHYNAMVQTGNGRASVPVRR